MSVEGECFCGEVGYRIEGTLREGRSCHCSRCRKAFSSQASAVAFIDPDDFGWTSGETLLTSYVGSHGYGYQFCKACGSTLTLVFKGDVMGVTLGCLNGDPDIELGMHVFVGSKASWEVIPEGVPQFEEWPPEAT